MTSFRPHRMFLDEALAEAYEVSSKSDLENKMGETGITIEKYGQGIDGRCGWDTHIVCDSEGRARGFTDGPLK